MHYDFEHDPEAELDYTIDWAKWLEVNDTIAAHAFTVPTGLTQPNASSHTDTTSTVWIAGGTRGRTYQVVGEITTTDGRTDQRTITLLVKDR